MVLVLLAVPLGLPVPSQVSRVLACLVVRVPAMLPVSCTVYREGEYPTLYYPVKTHYIVMLHHTPVQDFAAKDLLTGID